MKTAIVVVLLLAACGYEPVPPAAFKSAEQRCAAAGGLKGVNTQSEEKKNYRAVCRDGSYIYFIQGDQ